ncbi:MAG: hypothetical protein NWF07_07670 [Candidatus Bathyarchaeota archaeon]|nr:hypothetical protein [Candidatus Bathyarchaeota archaeon]
MSEHVGIEYRVTVTGLDTAQAAASASAESARQAGAALSNVQNQSSTTLPTLMMTVRTVNAARLAISQTSNAITELNPVALMYGFLNMIQVVNNLTSLTRILKDSTASASAAQAILASLTGNLYLIPMALAAGALVYSSIKSMQTGGPVNQTGLYLLHRGEYVVPANQTSIGPVYITFNRQPANHRTSQWLDQLSTRIMGELRR